MLPSLRVLQVMNELMTKDNGGWTPLVFAYRSGSRSIFLAAMEAFIERGEEGSRRVRCTPAIHFYQCSLYVLPLTNFHDVPNVTGLTLTLRVLFPM